MSFEEDKARLIQELADAQAETRAKYGMKPKSAVAKTNPAKKSETKGAVRPAR